jgi:hypothetical protein
VSKFHEVCTLTYTLSATPVIAPDFIMLCKYNPYVYCAENFISFDDSTRTISIQTNNASYKDTTFTLTITGTN